MLNIRSILSAVLRPAPAADRPPLPISPENEPDRIHVDLRGLSDTDSMWYYETRRWRGRD